MEGYDLSAFLYFQSFLYNYEGTPIVVSGLFLLQDSIMIRWLVLKLWRGWIKVGYGSAVSQLVNYVPHYSVYFIFNCIFILLLKQWRRRKMNWENLLVSSQTYLWVLDCKLNKAVNFNMYISILGICNEHFVLKNSGKMNY